MRMDIEDTLNYVFRKITKDEFDPSDYTLYLKRIVGA